ncbi:FAD/NAD(P)-binding domain-containing protein [Aspergillus heteromorphus CBS 117.55]|uniref:FAD/NAD(P)-binding domain-containing protein n=1 Tax=Aspergillus heteromorphus CBS 117.55 TaxID=1448321 RepID=A0A317VDC2_9EURO|nr:FAD/NAD(P)-binding domain-containing protein [Aspergillus heteromorphus CBS 117.55]PWY71008.1 FAD/NAD(P)-binding domain-containing protein [Aspergillus heteromorphus CBS 117.55]
MHQTMKPDFDAIVIGGGFGGTRMLYLLRENGFKVRGIERHQGLGGVWHANRYPGARCDSPQPFYQIHDETLVGGWTFSERFPDHHEMREYFRYVDSKWNVSKDFDFGVAVVQASFERDLVWTICLSDGRRMTTRWFIPAVGVASRPSLPEIKGIDQFQGELHHTGDWPLSEVPLQGKRVAVIGTGASGAQVVARIAPEVESLTVYQRTPVVVIPASPESSQDSNPHAVPLTPDETRAAFQRSATSFSGVDYSFQDPESVAIGSPLRDIFNMRLYREGSLGLVWGNFSDIFTNREANKQLYVFWATQTRAKIRDPVKKEILAPSKQPYPIGIKRACFVDNYYESFNRPNVDVVDIREAPLTAITKTGIQRGPSHREFDVIICATGFESQTSGITRLNITGRHGVPLAEAWKTRVTSYLGMTVPGFPNMFYLFGPQGPTVKVNVPTTVECQAQWILSFLKVLRASGVNCCEPTRSAAHEWQEELKRHWEDSLYLGTALWEARNSSDQPEPLWIQGIQKYRQFLQKTQARNFRGFVELRQRDSSVL